MCGSLVGGSMRLRDFLRELPYGKRKAFRERLAEAHGVSVSLVRKWENDPAPEDWDADKRRKQVRKHPVDLDAIETTEVMTGNQVTRYDLRPECWKREE